VKSGPARVLESLRRAGSRTASGEALSAEQGVSRAQVWKHVETLRSLGYGIEATPGDGYRLVELPDRLYPEEIGAGLETRWLAREIHYFEDTDSTNRVALELARSGAAHGTTVVAEGQSAGRGRLGRSFFSPPHLNLYASIVLRPQITTAEAPTWILAAAVIKWPNDVLLGGLKTSGILMELGAEATRVAFLVLGIGVNLNVDRSELPEEFRHLATSLSSHGGQRVDRVAFTRRLFRELEGVFDRCAAGSFESVRPDFESRFRMAGRPVTVAELGGERITGVALGIDDHGALRLESARGEEIRVIAGDVTVAKESP
jgi:BirA family biotin operon repressor/biotin-[acetyl-CoA-carboxylase] ligase